MVFEIQCISTSVCELTILNIVKDVINTLHMHENVTVLSLCICEFVCLLPIYRLLKKLIEQIEHISDSPKVYN